MIQFCVLRLAAFYRLTMTVCFQEHDHEAEQLISTLSLNPEDDELDVG